jgi:hypothetical protein
LGGERFDCWIADACHAGCNLMHSGGLKTPILANPNTGEVSVGVIRRPWPVIV